MLLQKQNTLLCVNEKYVGAYIILYYKHFPIVFYILHFVALFSKTRIVLFVVLREKRL